MTLFLTPQILAASYEYLRATPPFYRWRLPESDEVVFVVSRSWTPVAYYTRLVRKPDTHEIGVSGLRIGSTHRLMETVAHEMIHLRQDIRGETTPNTQHNMDFFKFTRVICRHHGFDEKAFI